MHRCFSISFLSKSNEKCPWVRLKKTKPRQLGLTLVSTSSCLTAALSPLPAATRNPHPGHPQEPVEHGREPHAHQVRQHPPVHRSAPRHWVGPGCSDHWTRAIPTLTEQGTQGRTAHVISNSLTALAAALLCAWGDTRRQASARASGLLSGKAFEIKSSRVKRDRPARVQGSTLKAQGTACVKAPRGGALGLCPRGQRNVLGSFLPPAAPTANWWAQNVPGEVGSCCFGGEKGRPVLCCGVGGSRHSCVRLSLP